MPGNSRRQGAVRKTGSKKGATVGSGGRRRKALEGRGPTPKAEERTYHPAYKRKQEAPQTRPRKAARPRSNNETVYGRNSVLEALEARIPVSSLHIASRIESDDRVRQILALVTDRRVPVMEAGRVELDRMTNDGVHQGVMLTVPSYSYADVEDLLDAAAAAQIPPLLVALDHVTDPRNLGAVIRSAGAFGAQGVVIPSRRAAGVTAAAWKVSAGALARVPVAQVTNLTRSLAEMRKAGIFVVGLDGGGEALTGDFPFGADPLCLVIGAEGKGLSRVVREQCDAIVGITIASDVESLNASVAAGIALYEVARTR